MFILIDSDDDGAPQVSLEEASDFRAFKVVISPTAGAAADEALAGLGAPAPPDHVFVERAAVEALAETIHTGDPDWRAGLDGMVGYAASHGWTDEEGRIRAHVERAS
jgi:hypothetical protein